MRPKANVSQSSLAEALHLERRKFLRTLSSVGAGIFAGVSLPVVAEPPPEITRVRFDFAPVLCMAPQYLAEELLHLEGFTQVEYIDIGTQLGPDAVVEGKIDFTLWDAASTVWAMDTNDDFVVLGGLHAGCWYLMGQTAVQSIRDLKGRKIAIRTAGDTDHAWISGALAYVGIDPRASIEWVVSGSYAESVRLFAEGRVDACLATPPRYQDLRTKQIGRVLVDSSQDRPWSQYYCCLVESSRAFVTRYPVATKRVMRALLKATDICAQEPERVAQYMVAKGYARSNDIALEVMKGLPYSRWRETGPEDTLRFYGLRFYDAGVIKSQPSELIRRATDLRILNELRRELRA